MSDRCAHGVTPASECEECIDAAIALMVKPYVAAAYESGRADARAAIVAWLLRDVAPRSVAEDIAAAIERGEDLPKGKP